MLTRRNVLELGAAAGTLALPDAAAEALVDPGDETFWSEVRRAFPSRQGPIRLVHSGGGDCPSATLDILARYQRIAAAGGEDGDPTLAALKESGSSMAIRRAISDAFGCDAEEVALTRNAMEGLGIGLLGIDLKAGDKVLTTRADYDSCIQMLRQRERRNGIRLKLIDVPMPAASDDDIVEAFRRGISPGTKLILMCHMYNKNGQILPVRRVADMARERGIVTVVDGAQSIGHLNFRIADLGCDVFATSLHKWFFAPRGTGFVYVRRSFIHEVWPIWPSWSGKQATDIEKFEDAGTGSKAIGAAMPSVFAFNAWVGSARKEARLRHLRDLWLNAIASEERVRVLTDRHPSRSCAIAAFNVEGVVPEAIARLLRDRHGIAIGTISLADKPDLKGNYVAASLTNSPDEVMLFADALRSTIRAV